MNILFLFAVVVSVITSLLVLRHFIREIIADQYKNRDVPLVLIGVAHVVYAVVLYFWYNGTFLFLLPDYIVIFSLVVLLQTIALLLIMYNSIRRVTVFSPLFLYVPLVFVSFVFPGVAHMVIPLSFLVILLFTF
jgi:hypothetical protein